MRERGIDLGLAAGFVLGPLLAAVAWSYLLGGGFHERLIAVVWVIMLFATRPAIWTMAEERPAMAPARAKVYRQRARAAANTSFAAAVLLGLGAMDVFPLPGSPYWLTQPRAGFALLAVVIYVVWLSTLADIPAEVSAGWGKLLGRRQEGWHA